jgi:sulfite reductase alpha subunit
MKRAAEKNPAAGDLLGLMERSYEDKTGHWKHGGIVGVRGYGGGCYWSLYRFTGGYPHLKEFHTMRVNQPSGWFIKPILCGEYATSGRNMAAV